VNEQGTNQTNDDKERAQMSEVTILVAEADRALGDLMCRELAADLGDAMHATTTEHARALAAQAPPDMLVLGDLESPRAATDLLRAMRAGDLNGDGLDQATPLLALCERKGELHRVRMLDLGADDAVTKPVAYVEVRARINAILRRVRPTQRGRVVRIGELVVDTVSRTVTVSGQPVELAKIEWRLLCQLIADPTRVWTKHELLRDVWGARSTQATRTLDSHACRLRRKLAQAGGSYVHNLWGVGYRLVDPIPVERAEEAA
jgi:DNA-binding response OmpR family regulator